MRKILFQHIAKTAGTSLIASLSDVFEGTTCPVRYDDELTEAVMTDPDFVFYHGHFSFDKVAEFRALVPDAFIFTFIRHPVDRVISQYYNWIDEERTKAEYEAIRNRGAFSEDYVEERLAKFSSEIAGLSLGQFIRSDDRMVSEVTINHQTRYLSPRKVYRHQPLEGLDAAARNLDEFFDYVGVTEHYELCVRQLEDRLGLDDGALPANVRRNANDRHKSDGRYTIGYGDLQLLLGKVQLDLALYAHCAGVFRARNGILDDPASRLFPSVTVEGRPKREAKKAAKPLKKKA